MTWVLRWQGDTGDRGTPWWGGHPQRRPVSPQQSAAGCDVLVSPQMRPWWLLQASQALDAISGSPQGLKPAMSSLGAYFLLV